jgi:hypothetical protein
MTQQPSSMFMTSIENAPSQPPQFPSHQPAHAHAPGAPPHPHSASPSGGAEQARHASADGSVAAIREKKLAADARNSVLSLQHVLLVAVTIMFSQMPIVTKILYRSAPSMFSSRGTYNISGQLITSIGFSLLYYGGVKMMHFLMDE